MELEGDKYDLSDIKAYSRSALNDLSKDVQKALAKNTSRSNRIHLEDVLERINSILDADKKEKGKA